MKTVYLVHLPYADRPQATERLQAYLRTVDSDYDCACTHDGVVFSTGNKEFARVMQAYVDGRAEAELDRIEFHGKLTVADCLEMAEGFRRAGLPETAKEFFERAWELM